MSLLSRLARKGRHFFRRTLFVQVWALPVWLLLGLARLAIKTWSFQRIARWLLQVPQAPVPSVPLLSSAGQVRARQIAQVIELASRHAPFTANCFPQALVVSWLLRWHGLPGVMCFGLKKSPASNGGLHGSTVQAHAWVQAGPVAVTGGRGFEDHAVVGCYLWWSRGGASHAR